MTLLFVSFDTVAATVAVVGWEESGGLSGCGNVCVSIRSAK